MAVIAQYELAKAVRVDATTDCLDKLLSPGARILATPMYSDIAHHIGLNGSNGEISLDGVPLSIGFQTESGRNIIAETQYGVFWDHALNLMTSDCFSRIDHHNLSYTVFVVANTILNTGRMDNHFSDHDPVITTAADLCLDLFYSVIPTETTQSVGMDYPTKEDLRAIEKIFFEESVSSNIDRIEVGDIELALAATSIVLSSIARATESDSSKLRSHALLALREVLVPTLAYHGFDSIFALVIDEIGINFNPGEISEKTIKICRHLNPSYRVPTAPRFSTPTYQKAEASRKRSIRELLKDLSNILPVLSEFGGVELTSGRAKSPYTVSDKVGRRKRTLTDFETTQDTIIPESEQFFTSRHPENPHLLVEDLDDPDAYNLAYYFESCIFDILAVQFVDTAGIIGEGLTGDEQNDRECIERINKFLKLLYIGSDKKIVPLYLNKEYLKNTGQLKPGQRPPFLNIKVKFNGMVVEMRFIRKQDKAAWPLQHRLYKLAGEYDLDFILSNRFILLTLLTNGGYKYKEAYNYAKEIADIGSIDQRETKLYELLQI